MLNESDYQMEIKQEIKVEPLEPLEPLEAVEALEQTTDSVKNETQVNNKLERLKKGLVFDTLRMTGIRLTSVKDSQIIYGLKSGRFGTSDPMRKRSKLFRSAIARFAPPFYFWHKETINEMKYKPFRDQNPIQEPPEDESLLYCVWCHLIVECAKYHLHRTNYCTKRFSYLWRGFYRCDSCKEGFISEYDLQTHESLHFPGRRRHQLEVQEGEEEEEGEEDWPEEEVDQEDHEWAEETKEEEKLEEDEDEELDEEEEEWAKWTEEIEENEKVEEVKEEEEEEEDWAKWAEEVEDEEEEVEVKEEKEEEEVKEEKEEEEAKKEEEWAKWTEVKEEDDDDEEEEEKMNSKRKRIKLF